MTAPGERRGRISRRSVERLRRRLSARDQAVLRSVERVRLLGAKQLERLHFVEGSSLTRSRRCRATLQRLTETGCLVRLERRIGGVRAGSAGFIYALTPLGQRVLHPDAIRLKRVREPGGPFVEHVLAINEVWVQLVEAERRGELVLEHFEHEPACWRRFTSLGGTSWIKPDARVVLISGEWERHAFLEVDLGTESFTVLRRKAEQFAAYWQTGQEQARSGVFPRVTFLVPDTRRAERLVETLARLPPEHWQLFQVRLLGEAVPALVQSGHAPPTEPAGRGAKHINKEGETTTRRNYVHEQRTTIYQPDRRGDRSSR